MRKPKFEVYRRGAGATRVRASVAILALALTGWSLWGDPEPFDLAAEIARACGPPGYQLNAGCRVELPKGTSKLKPLTVGDCTAMGVRPNLVIEGVSAGETTQGSTRYPVAGSTLQYDGLPGEVMVGVCGANRFALRNLHLDARGAKVAVRLSSNNATGAITHMPELVGVSIDGSAIGVWVTGEHYDDQTDFTSLERVTIRNVGIGFLQDSQQAASTKLDQVDIAAFTKGIEIRDGQFACDHCYVGSYPPRADHPEDVAFIGFHFRDNPNAQGHAFQTSSIEHSHLEVDRGRMIVTEGGSQFPLRLDTNTYNPRCRTTGCEQTIGERGHRGVIVQTADIVAPGTPYKPKVRWCNRNTVALWIKSGVRATASIGAVTVGCL